MWSKLHQDIVWESSNVTFLRNTIEHNLKYDMQASICLKRNEKLNILARITKFFPFKSKCLFIKTFIEPQFTYCLLVQMLRRQVIIYDLLATPDRTLPLVIFD